MKSPLCTNQPGQSGNSAADSHTVHPRDSRTQGGIPRVHFSCIPDEGRTAEFLRRLIARAKNSQQKTEPKAAA